MREPVALAGWKVWHRKLLDVLGMKINERTLTLEAVRELKQQHGDLLAALKAVLEAEQIASEAAQLPHPRESIRTVFAAMQDAANLARAAIAKARGGRVNSRTKEALVVLRCLRMHFEHRFPDTRKAHAMMADMFDRPADDAEDIVELALNENEDRAREEIRRELGEEVEGVATVQSTTLREAQGVDDEEPTGG